MTDIDEMKENCILEPTPIKPERTYKDREVIMKKKFYEHYVLPCLVIIGLCDYRVSSLAFAKSLTI